MQPDEGTRRDYLGNQIHATGSKFNKNLPVAALKLEAERIKQYLDKLLPLLRK